MDLSVSHERNVIAAASARGPLQIAETGEPFVPPALTPPVRSLIAIAPDHHKDRFFAYDALGRTFVTGDDGEMVLTVGAPLPSEVVPVARGLSWDDGEPPSLLFQGKDGTIWKDTSELGSTDGYVRRP